MTKHEAYGIAKEAFYAYRSYDVGVPVDTLFYMIDPDDDTTSPTIELRWQFPESDIKASCVVNMLQGDRELIEFAAFTGRNLAHHCIQSMEFLKRNGLV